MKEFLLVFRAIEDTSTRTPEQRGATMELWKNWMGGIAQQGKLVGGQPLMPGGRLMSKTELTDAPFAEGKEVLNGYMIMKAKDYDEAVQLSKPCPIFESNGTVEVREIAKMDS